MQIRFHGATRTVTGSLHEVMAGGKRLLLDCGLFQGPRELANRINKTFDFDVHSVDAVILSHGHQDHCGNLPNLVRQGFAGRVYCTPATRVSPGCSATTAIRAMVLLRVRCRPRDRRVKPWCTTTPAIWADTATSTTSRVA